jgi:hypothetical protein
MQLTTMPEFRMSLQRLLKLSRAITTGSRWMLWSGSSGPGGALLVYETQLFRSFRGQEDSSL